ncbi:MAG: SsrA-binding protein SmpB [Candidatus Zapsychrus exili]|nr:SsrA-binding protein SmpB [Candidatus Zapsychrus exili]
MASAIATNKKAYRDYFFSETWECGIALEGAEVKSIRAGGISFKDSFAKIEKEEIYLYSLHITGYQNSGYESIQEDRRRKLLLHKKEIKKIISRTLEKNLALIPTKVYFNKRGFVKVELALGCGKKFYDKREAIKKRTIDRDIRRTLRQDQKKSTR